MTTNEKLARISHLIALGNRTKAELDGLDDKIAGLVAAGGQPNVIEKILLNGVEQTPDDNKAVSLTVNVPEYTVVKDDNAGEYAAVYHLTKDGVNVGAAINIPKDMVVKSGSVVGDEIVLVLNDDNATEIKIPVGSLIEYVTSGSAAGDMVFITVDETTHKVTATITDGTIGAAKLTTEVQTALGKAHEHANKAELDLIAAGDKAKWDQAVTDVNAVKADYLKGSDKTELQDNINTVDGKFDSYYTSTQIDGMMATDEEVTAALDGIFGTTEG